MAARSAIVGIGADQRRYLARQTKDALHALILAAELLVEGDVLQMHHAVFERDLAILVEEELGVGEPRADHPLIAFGDLLAAVLGFEIGDEDEVVRERVAFRQRETFLMRLHGGRQHLGRHGQEVLIELAHQHHGPFGQPRVLGEQRLVLDERKPLLPMRAYGRCLAIEAARSAAIENDEGRRAASRRSP